MTALTVASEVRPETFEELLERQHGVVALTQLGWWLTPDEVSTEVHAGRWRRFCRGVV